MSQNNIYKIIEPFKKTAWFPKVELKSSASSASKFSGIPTLLDGEEWPCCENCREPMQLFLQLNSEHLPIEAGTPFGEGILQVFYCTNEDENCEFVCEASLPFSKSTLVRVIKPTSSVDFRDIECPVKDPFPEKAIVDWEAKEDYPNWEELEELGCTLTDKQLKRLWKLKYPLSKDKLLGWPDWVQGIEYPDCRHCGRRMKLIFQIDSEDNLPYMFGDGGCSHITQCQFHKEEMAIAWACH